MDWKWYFYLITYIAVFVAVISSSDVFSFWEILPVLIPITIVFLICVFLSNFGQKGDGPSDIGGWGGCGGGYGGGCGGGCGGCGG